MTNASVAAATVHRDRPQRRCQRRRPRRERAEPTPAVRVSSLDDFTLARERAARCRGHCRRSRASCPQSSTREQQRKI